MHKTFNLLAPGTLLLGVFSMTPAVVEHREASTPFLKQTALQLASFNSIEVLDGGHVVLRPGSTQRVNLLRGTPDYTRLAVIGRRLVIDRCDRKCPRGYQMEVEIFSPSFERISVSNGGRAQSVGEFPRQTQLVLAVAHGGTIDVRSMDVDRVTASVEQGGGILTAPRSWLFARINQGGVITYWGDAQVRSSVGHGGAVNKGIPSQIDAPLSEVVLSVPSPTRHH